MLPSNEYRGNGVTMAEQAKTDRISLEEPMVRTPAVTDANEADVTMVGELLHGKESQVHADAGYAGADKRVGRKKHKWEIAQRRGKMKAMADLGDIGLVDVLHGFDQRVVSVSDQWVRGIEDPKQRLAHGELRQIVNLVDGGPAYFAVAVSSHGVGGSRA